MDLSRWREPVRRLALIAALSTFACFGLLTGPPYFSTASVPARYSFDPGLEVSRRSPIRRTCD